MSAFLIRRPLAVLFIFLAYATTWAQGWERTFGGVASDVANGLLPTPDKGWLLVGSTQSFGSGDRDIYLLKTDVDGKELWHRHIGLGGGIDELGNAVLSGSDGGFVIGGTRIENGVSTGLMIATDKAGEVIWEALSSLDSTEIIAIANSRDGGFIATGRKFREDGKHDIFVVKTDALGQENWISILGGNDVDVSTGVVALPDGSSVISGFSHSGTSSFDAYLAKLDDSGNTVWEKRYGEDTAEEQALSISILTDGNLLVCGLKNDQSGSEDDTWLLKTDPDGSVIWEESYPLPGLEKARALAELPDGTICIAGEHRSDSNADRNVWLVKTDQMGQLIWSRTFGGINGDDANDIAALADGSLALCGFTQSFGAGSADAYLIRTAADGRSFTARIEGNVFIDDNLDCLFEPAEKAIGNWLVEITGTHSVYTNTDTSGFFSLTVDTGLFTVRLISPNAYWIPCENAISVTLTNVHDTMTVNFPVQKTSDCSFLTVDISTPFLRRCFPNTYQVSYCNLGTQSAIDAEIALEYDPFLRIDGSSIPWQSHVGNRLVFSVGELRPLECGQFQIFTTVHCDSTVLGQTHCMEAHIRPDSICLPADPAWDHASIEVDAACEGDSVVFLIRNVGKGNMQRQRNFIIIEDQIISKIGGVQLLSGDIKREVVHPDGKTVRLEVEQSDGHPGRSAPSVTVEGCGNSLFSTGFVTQYSQDDGDNFIEIDCQENIGSFDPNDKRGFPKGYGTDHLIDQNTDIEYLIRFQNTGTDTAFSVVIRDTLSGFLDPATIFPGSSSHPYAFEIYGNGIVKFTFSDILLPDSHVNEPASHGFVKFRIAQQADLPIGTVIPNSADIYFDFNEPVLTNKTLHRIGKDYILVGVNDPTDDRTESINIFPNPAQQLLRFELPLSWNRYVRFVLTDAMGRPVFSDEKVSGSTYFMARNGLPAGIYFFKFENHDGQLRTGRILFQ